MSEKVEIMREIDRGVKNVVVCKTFGFPPSTVSTILKKKQFYISSFAKKISSCKLSNLESELIEYFRIERISDIKCKQNNVSEIFSMNNLYLFSLVMQCNSDYL